MQAIVLVAVLEKLQYTGPFKICGATAVAIEVAAYGAGHAVLVYLAYIYEEVTVLSTTVKPFL
ncbi:MAG: hypothetical protein JSV54_09050 [Chloroflexota bacterium]|nr:MAG: hypothetical protein JSV54_09050 [Chloroflexota bacterium]